MYHYETCGLDGIYLRNGFTEKETPYGSAVSIHNVEGLHRAIGMDIVYSATRMTGKEFRFLRKEVGLTQASLATLLEYDRQTIIKWEKSVDPIPKLAGVALKQMYVEDAKLERTRFSQLLEELNELDRQLHGLRREFIETDEGWTEVKLAA